MNADSVNLLPSMQDRVAGSSVFVYCENNPINIVDYAGSLTIAVFAKYALKMLMGIVGVYATDVVFNMIRGLKGKKVFTTFSSGWGDYISGALSALLPGNRWVKAAGSAVIESLNSTLQNVIKKKRRASVATVIKTFLNNFITATIIALFSKFFSIAVDRLSPKNYSSFAHSKYLKDAKLKPEQIKKQMRNRFKQIKVSKAVFDYIANVLAGAAKKKKYSWS